MPSYDGEIKLSVKLTPDEIRKSASDLRSEIEKIFNTSGDNLDKSFQRVATQMDKLYTKSQALEDELQKLANQQVPTEGYAEMQKELEKAESTLEKLYTKREQYEDLGKKVPEALAYQIEMAEDAVARLTRDMETMERTGKAFTLGTDTEEFARKSQELAELNNQVRLLTNNVPRLQTFSSKLRQVASSIMSMAGRNVMSGIEKLKSGLKSLGNRFTHTAKKAQRLTKSFFMAMIGVRGLFMLFRKLRSAISEGIKNIQEFDKENNEFAKSMETLKANTSFMKNAFGAAFAPLIQLVIPYLNMATQAIGNFMNQVAALFAMLGGKSTFIAAKSQVDEYGNAINKAAGAQKKLNAELYGFDTLNRQQDKSGGSGSNVSDMFEQLETASVLPESWLNFVNKLKTLWETIKELWKNKEYFEIGKVISQFIKDLIPDDWSEVYRKVEELVTSLTNFLNGLMDDPEMFYKAGKMIAAGINILIKAFSTFAKTFRWDKLGEDVGEGINGFVDEFDAKELAEGIDAFVKGLWTAFKKAVGTIDWKDVFASLYEFLSNISIDTISIVAGVIIIKAVGQWVLSSVIPSLASSLFAGLAASWTSLGGLGSILTMDVGTIIGAGTVAEIGIMLGTALIGGFAAAIGGFWVGTSLGKLLLGDEAPDMTGREIAQELLDGFKQGDLWPAMADWWVDWWETDMMGWFKDIGKKASEWAKNIYRGFIEWEGWSAIAEWWSTFWDLIVTKVKKIFGINSPSTVFADIGYNLIEGFKNGIIDTWNKVKDGIYNTFDSIKTKVEDIFKIGSPSRIFEEYGRFIDLGFAEGIEGDKSAVEMAMDDMMRGVSASATLTPNFNVPNLSRIPIPALATGGVVPPSAYGSSSQTDFNTILGRIQTLIDKIDEDRDRTIELHNHVELDGDEIYNNVVEHNNQQIQRSGSSRLKV